MGTTAFASQAILVFLFHFPHYFPKSRGKRRKTGEAKQKHMYNIERKKKKMAWGSRLFSLGIADRSVRSSNSCFQLVRLELDTQRLSQHSLKWQRRYRSSSSFTCYLKLRSDLSSRYRQHALVHQEIELPHSSQKPSKWPTDDVFRRC